MLLEQQPLTGGPADYAVSSSVPHLIDSTHHNGLLPLYFGLNKDERRVVTWKLDLEVGQVDVGVEDG